MKKPLFEYSHTIELQRKAFQYKTFTVVLNTEGEFDIYTKDEMMQPAFCRDIEFTCGNAEIAKQWIDSYDTE